MSNVTRQPRGFKPATKEVHGVCRWTMRPIRPTHNDLNGGAGLLNINGTDYMFLFLADRVADGVVVRGYSLTKADGSIYHLDAAEGCRCDCPDHEFHPERPGGCKHMRAVKAALAVLDGDRPAPVPPHAPAAKPAFRSTGDMARNAPEVFDDFEADAA